MSASLWRALAYLYPGQEEGFETGRDASGNETITRWDLDDPQPTEEQIATARDAVGRQMAKDRLSDEARESLDTGWVLAEGDDAAAKRDELFQVLLGQVAALCGALGVPLDPRLQQVLDTAVALQAKHEEVDAAVDPDDVTWGDG